ncbi:methyl-accepting chemotaxis protein [Paenibacillus protaetiae]|nr:methyl-accepting chemotaxis protein [Paenibacillus protaetiae]
MYAFSSFYLLSVQSDNVNKMKTSIYDISYQVDTLVLNADRDMYQALVAYSNLAAGQFNGSSKEQELKNLNDNLKETEDRMMGVTQIVNTQQLLDMKAENGKKVSELLADFNEQYNAWSDMIQKTVQTGRFEISADMKQKFEAGRASLDALGNMTDNYADSQINDIQGNVDTTEKSIYVSIVVISVVLIGLAIAVLVPILRTIRKVVMKTVRLADGDLTVEADSKYRRNELGDMAKALDRMISSIRGLVGGIAATAEVVSQSASQMQTASHKSAEGAEHIAASAKEVSQGSRVQANAAGETAKAIEEMTVGIGRIAENTLSIADHSTLTSEQVEESHTAVMNISVQMGRVREEIDQLTQIIQSLELRSEQIAAIAESITAFANQTNILSLNASIEAARAGEHGKGFAVVAEEIRKLASSSLQSVDGIGELVSETKQEISQVSGSMDRTSAAFQQGSVLVQDLRSRLDAIVQSMQLMTEQLQENSAITEQMSASSEEVSAAMEQSASAGVSNLALTEQVTHETDEQIKLLERISEGSSRLNEVVAELTEQLNQFKLK